MRPPFHNFLPTARRKNKIGRGSWKVSDVAPILLSPGRAGFLNPGWAGPRWTPLQFRPGSLPLSRPVLTWVCGEPSNSSLTCDYVVKI